jgi:hypothetical protein
MTYRIQHILLTIVSHTKKDTYLVVNPAWFRILKYINMLYKSRDNLQVILNFGRRAVAPQILYPSCAYAWYILCLPMILALLYYTTFFIISFWRLCLLLLIMYIYTNYLEKKKLKMHFVSLELKMFTLKVSTHCHGGVRFVHTYCNMSPLTAVIIRPR